MWEDSEIRFFIFSALGLFLLLIIFIVFFINIYYKKQVSFLRQQEQLRFEFNQELLRTQLEIQEQTLKTISQEIHDNIGQMLSLAKLNLALANNETDNGHPARGKITDSHQLVSKSIQDLRDLSHSLNTDYVSEMGLHRSVEYELEMLRKTGTMKTELRSEGNIRRLDKQKELIVFRIVQESLNNIIKHANASSLTLSIKYLPQELLLSILDNGQGVDLTPLNDSSSTGFGLGIRNMHNRAKLIGGDFSMHSTLQQGTEVIIKVPYE